MRTLTYTALPADEGRAAAKLARGRLGVSARQFAHIKAQNLLFVNGRPEHADYRARAGDVITVCFPEDPLSEINPQAEEIQVAYEDEDYVIVEKPAPLATQSSVKQPDNTLENRFVYRYRDQPGYVFRPVNRLDKGTSGLMVVAKNAHAQMLLARQLHTDDFVREYLAVTDGIPDPPSGVIDAPIAKAPMATVRRVIDPVNGREARTRYAVISAHGSRALVRLRLETGRTHQIRVHLQSVGCPVYGDFLYGTEQPEKLPGRFALHCAHMRFTHPFSGTILSFDVPLPPALQSALLDET